MDFRVWSGGEDFGSGGEDFGSGGGSRRGRRKEEEGRVSGSPWLSSSGGGRWPKLGTAVVDLAVVVDWGSGNWWRLAAELARAQEPDGERIAEEEIGVVLLELRRHAESIWDSGSDARTEMIDSGWRGNKGKKKQWGWSELGGRLMMISRSGDDWSRLPSSLHSFIHCEATEERPHQHRRLRHSFHRPRHGDIGFDATPARLLACRQEGDNKDRKGIQLHARHGKSVKIERQATVLSSPSSFIRNTERGRLRPARDRGCVRAAPRAGGFGSNRVKGEEQQEEQQVGVRPRIRARATGASQPMAEPERQGSWWAFQ